MVVARRRPWLMAVKSSESGGKYVRGGPLSPRRLGLTLRQEAVTHGQSGRGEARLEFWP